MSQGLSCFSPALRMGAVCDSFTATAFTCAAHSQVVNLKHARGRPSFRPATSKIATGLVGASPRTGHRAIDSLRMLEPGHHACLYGYSRALSLKKKLVGGYLIQVHS